MKRNRSTTTRASTTTRSAACLALAALAACHSAALAQQVFIDNFNNGSIPDSNTRTGFWNQVVDGAGTLTETVGGNGVTLRSQSGGPGNAFPYTQLASPLQNDFNFFRAPVVLSATGLGYAPGDSTLALTQFTLTSQALDSAGPQTEYQAQDAVSLWVTNRLSTNNGTGVGSLVMGLKLDGPNRSTAFEGFPMIGSVGNIVRGVQAFPGQIRAFKLILGPTFFNLTVSHDTSTVNATQVSVSYSGALDLYRTDSPYGANWGNATNPQGDAAVNIQTQLNNAPSTTPLANFKVGTFAVAKFQRNFVGSTFGAWSNPASWSEPGVVHPNGDGSTNNVPNHAGAVARFGPAALATTVLADLDQTVGSITFDSAQPYTVTTTGNGQGTLRLASRYPEAELRVVSGTGHAILSPVIFSVGSDALLTADAAGASLAVPYLTLESPSIQKITKTGPGRIDTGNLDASTVTLAGGTLRIVPNDGTYPGQPTGPTTITTLDFVGGHLDLTRNDMIVRSGSLSSLRTAVQSWLNGGTYDGAGLGSSLANAITHTTLAVISNDAGGGTPFFENFDGVPVSASDLLVKYTYVGDTNLDGKVDGTDLANAIEGYSTNATGWQNGDTNYDGVITPADIAALMAALTNQGAPFPSSGSNTLGGTSGAIPEPGTLALFALAPLLTRRRR